MERIQYCVCMNLNSMIYDTKQDMCHNQFVSWVDIDPQWEIWTRTRESQDSHTIWK